MRASGAIQLIASLAALVAQKAANQTSKPRWQQFPLCIADSMLL
jgi:hypothetical protein